MPIPNNRKSVISYPKTTDNEVPWKERLAQKAKNLGYEEFSPFARDAMEAYNKRHVASR